MGGPQRQRLFGDPPEPFWFRTARFEAGTVFPPLRQPWGKLLYAVNGIVEFNIEGRHYLSPPAYAIWIPPDVLHQSLVGQDTSYAVIYIKRELCDGLPTTPCTLVLSALVKAIVADFAARKLAKPASEEDLRLGQVILDQLRQAPRYQSYLPSSDDPLLGRLLRALEAAPDDRRSMAEWARMFGTTERTLARRFREQIGISFGDWRQRLKLVTALALLDGGHTVQSIAYQLGYGSPSAFIAMFRQMTGTSPEQMRRLGGPRERPQDG